MTVADLFLIPAVREKLIFLQFFDKDSIKYLLGLAVLTFIETYRID